MLSKVELHLNCPEIVNKTFKLLLPFSTGSRGASSMEILFCF